MEIQDLNEMASNEETVIVDAIHGHMIIPAVCIAVIDTPEFQRLRNITQCGLSCYVYPTANHSRFEHSLGVCYFSRLFMECLKKSSDESSAYLTQKEQLCIQLAGLCHDLGHGPFSHTWEKFYPDFQHEEMSKKIFKHIYDKYEEVRNTFKDNGIMKEDVEFICDIITNGSLKKRDDNNYLYEIIANKTSGIDVDKLEYLKRDAHQFGMNFSMDVFRIFNNARIIKIGKRTTIAYRDKIHGNIFDMFLTRAKMHYLCYKHTKSICIEQMLVDALKESDQEQQGYLSQVSKCENEDLEEFLKLDNSIINRLKGENAKKLIERIYRRDIYKLILEEIIPKDKRGNIDEIQKKVLEDINNKINARLSKNEQGEWFKSGTIKLDMGGNSGDPLKNVNFYDKSNNLINYGAMEKSFLSRFYSKDTHFSCDMIIVYCTWSNSKLSELGLSLEFLEFCKKTASDSFKDYFEKRS